MKQPQHSQGSFYWKGGLGDGTGASPTAILGVENQAFGKTTKPEKFTNTSTKKIITKPTTKTYQNTNKNDYLNQQPQTQTTMITKPTTKNY